MSKIFNIISVALISASCFSQTASGKEFIYNPRTIPHVSNVAEAQKAFAEGSRRLGVHHYRQALSFFSMSIAADKSAEAYAYRASCYQHLEQPQLAFKDANMAISLDPKCAAAYHTRGELYWEKQEFDKALKDSFKSCELDPKNPDFLYDSGKMCEGTGHLEDALHYFARARVASPHAPASYHIGAIEMKCGKYKEAIADFTRSLSEQGLDGSEATYADRAFCYEKLGKMDLARKDRARAKSITEDGWGKIFGQMK